MFQLNVARALAAQLAVAVEHVHAQDIVYGDLHLDNILLKAPPHFDRLSVESLYDEYGAPELEAVVHLDGKPLPPVSRPTALHRYGSGRRARKSNLQKQGSCSQILARPFHPHANQSMNLVRRLRCAPLRLALNRQILFLSRQIYGHSLVLYGQSSLEGRYSKTSPRPRMT